MPAKHVYMALLLLLMAASVQAQHQKLRLCIADAFTRKPIADVQALAYAKNEIVALQISNNNGLILLETENNIDSVVLGLMGYENRMLIQPPQGFYDTCMAILLTPASSQLQPILLKSRRQRLLRTNGDTSTYNVAQLRLPTDRTMEDVLRRIPGVKVSHSGQISYNDKPISGLTIDDDDLLGNRYTLATRSLRPEDVDSVQVQDNTQKILALAQLQPSQAVYINLKMNAHARRRPIGHAEMAAGMPALYQVQTTALFLSRRLKQLHHVLANNTRPSLLQALLPQALGEGAHFTLPAQPAPFYQIGLVQIQADIPADLWQQNQSAGTAHQFFLKTKKGHQWKGSVGAALHNLKHTQVHTSKWWFSTDSLQATERMNTELRTKQIHASIEHEQNKQSHFLSAILSTQLAETNNAAQVSSPTENRVQQLFMHHFSGYAGLRFVKPLGQDWLVNCKAEASRIPALERNEYNIPTATNLTDVYLLPATLRVAQRALNTETSAKAQASVFWQGLVKTGIAVEHKSVYHQIHLQQWDVSATARPMNAFYTGRTNNEVHQQKASLVAHYLHDKFSLSVQGGALRILAFAQNELRGNDAYKGLFPVAELRIQKTLGRSHQFKLNAQWNAAIDDQTPAMVPTPLLLSYRLLRTNSFLFPTVRQQQISAVWQYKKTVKLLFTNVGIGHFHLRNNAIVASDITGLVLRTTQRFYANNESRLWVQGWASKFWFALGARFDALYRHERSLSPVWQQQTLFTANTLLHLAELNMHKKLGDWFVAEAGYSLAFARAGNTNEINAFTSTQQQAKLVASFLHGPWTLKNEAEAWQVQASGSARQRFITYQLRLDFMPPKSAFQGYLWMQNLLNQQYLYSNRVMPGFQSVQQTLLRPKQLVLGCRYVFSGGQHAKKSL